MSAPIGDCNGTRSGCRTTLFLALLSTLLVLVLIAVAATFLADAIQPERPQPTSSTSTRSTP